MKVTKITNLPVQDNEGRLYYTVRVDTDAGIHGLGEVGIRSWGRAIANAVDHLGECIRRLVVQEILNLCLGRW